MRNNSGFELTHRNSQKTNKIAMRASFVRVFFAYVTHMLYIFFAYFTHHPCVWYVYSLSVLRLFSSDAYVYVRVLNTRQWTSLRVLSTPYVYGTYVKKTHHWKTSFNMLRVFFAHVTPILRKWPRHMCCMWVWPSWNNVLQLHVLNAIPLYMYQE